jgi:Na+-transporting methylmalonyl-CoA/oxaloacetate decarboxylase gamma subunit
MGVQNILDNDGIGLAITGMLIVFVGLILISLFIAALPRVIARADQEVQRHRERRVAESAHPVGSGLEDPALRAAIALVIQMELDREQVLDAQKITMERDEAQIVWGLAGKMRTLSKRL